MPLGIDTNEFRIAALDTGTVRHGLEKTTYAVRVKECQELVTMLQRQGYKIQSLGDIKDRKTYVLLAKRRLNQISKHSTDQLLFDISGRKEGIMAKHGASHPHLCERLEYLFGAQERFEAMVKAWSAGDIEEVWYMELTHIMRP